MGGYGHPTRRQVVEERSLRLLGPADDEGNGDETHRDAAPRRPTPPRTAGPGRPRNTAQASTLEPYVRQGTGRSAYLIVASALVGRRDGTQRDPVNVGQSGSCCGGRVGRWRLLG